MSKITAVEVKSDKDGFWYHPEFPSPANDREAFAEGELEAWLTENNVVMKRGYMSEMCRVDEYGPDNDDVRDWNPSEPEGEGWFLAAIYDHEDGPQCIWLRDAEIDRHESELLTDLKAKCLSAHKLAELAAYDYFRALPVGPEREYAAEIYQRIRLATSRSGEPLGKGGFRHGNPIKSDE